MKTIWKYSLGSRRSVINVPFGGRSIAFAIQNQVAVVYFEVVQSNTFAEREVYLFHTGEEFDSHNLIYVGTALTKHDTYVLHCYVNEP